MTTSAGKRPRLLLCVVVASVLLLPFVWFALGMSDDVIAFSGPTMGTKYTIRLVTDWQHSYKEKTQELVDTRLAEINKLMSTYDLESELSQFNHSGSTDWFPVSEETASVVEYALKVAEESRGAFDPTVGPLVNLWGFGPNGRRREPPSEDEIESARQSIGFQNLEVRLEPPALRKAIPNLQVDLSAIAKGYAADAIGHLLDKLGYESYMVEIGGEVVTSGTKPGGMPWRIGIEKPDSAGRDIEMVVEFTKTSKNRALATSGDYRNYFVHDGMRYSHTIDPRTGNPVTHDLATVTVLAESCMRADALATALLALGPRNGYDWAEKQEIITMLVSRKGDEYESLSTTGWQETVGAEIK